MAGDPPAAQLTLSNNKAVPDVESYKYLGVHLGQCGYNRKNDLNARRKKCWAVIRAFSEVSRSFVPLATKRLLFAAVIGGLWTYAELAWPAHLSADMVCHSTFSRMLRYCLNVPPSFAGGPHTEELYATQPFLPAMLRRHRLEHLGHWVRDHLEGRRFLWAAQVLTWQPSTTAWPRRPGGQLLTINESILRESGEASAQEMIDHMMDRDCWKFIVKRAEAERQREVQSRVWNARASDRSVK